MASERRAEAAPGPYQVYVEVLYIVVLCMSITQSTTRLIEAGRTTALNLKSIQVAKYSSAKHNCWRLTATGSNVITGISPLRRLLARSRSMSAMAIFATGKNVGDWRAVVFAEKCSSIIDAASGDKRASCEMAIINSYFRYRQPQQLVAWAELYFCDLYRLQVEARLSSLLPSIVELTCVIDIHRTTMYKTSTYGLE